MERVKSLLGKAASFASSYVGEAALEGAVLGLFDNFSLEDLLGAIRGNVNVWGSDWGEYEHVRSEFLELSKNPKWREHFDLLNAENVLEWLRSPDARPDIASLMVNTPGGVEWLSRQVAQIRSVLEGTA